MSYAAANIVDFIRGFGQRKLDAQTSDIEKNYLDDPQGTVNQVQKLNPTAGFKLQSYYADQQKAKADQATAAQAAKDAKIQTGIKYLRSMPQGADPSAYVSSISPVLKAQDFDDDDINGLTMLAKSGINYDNLDDKVYQSAHESKVVAPGGEIGSAAGGVALRNPLPDKFIPQGSAQTGYTITRESQEPPAAGVPAAGGPQPTGTPGISTVDPNTQLRPGYIAQGGDPFDDHIAPIEGGTNRDGTPRVSPKGARGGGQVMPATGPEAAAAAGVPWDPNLFNANTKAGDEYTRKLGKAYYAKQLVGSGGDEVRAAAAYNAGPGRTNRAYGGPVPPGAFARLPPETQRYVQNFAPGLFGQQGGQAAPAAAPASNVQQTIPAAPPKPTAPIYTPGVLSADETKKMGFPDGVVAGRDQHGNVRVLYKPAASSAKRGGAADPVSGMTNTFDALEDLGTQITGLRDDPALSTISGMTGHVMQYTGSGHDVNAKIKSLNASKLVTIAKTLQNGGNPFSRITNMEAQQLPSTLAAVAPGQSYDGMKSQLNTGLGRLSRSWDESVLEGRRQGIIASKGNGKMVMFNGSAWVPLPTPKWYVGRPQ